MYFAGRICKDTESDRGVVDFRSSACRPGYGSGDPPPYENNNTKNQKELQIRLISCFCAWRQRIL
jgi:hypothetical protein